MKGTKTSPVFRLFVQAVNESKKSIVDEEFDKRLREAVRELRVKDSK